jgi:hypothetical protein
VELGVEVERESIKLKKLVVSDGLDLVPLVTDEY